MSERFRAAQWVTVEQLDEGRWRMTLLDDADDELGTVTIGVEGSWDPDAQAHVEFALARLGLVPQGSRAWRTDELGAQRAPVLPLA